MNEPFLTKIIINGIYFSLWIFCGKKKEKKKNYTHCLKLKKGKKKKKKLLYLPKIIVTVISFEDTMSGPDV